MMPPVNESNATQAGGARLRLAIPVLLPDVGDSRDACVARLTTILEGRRGVQRVHVEETPESAGSPTGSLLCLHYDPEQITLADLERMAVAAGAELTNQFAHATIPVRMVGAEDDGLRIEAALRALPGVTAAVVNTAAQAARVEFDRTRIDLPAIEAEFERLGVTAGADETPEDGADGRGWYGRNHELVWSLTAGALVAAGWAMNRATPGSSVATGLFVGAYFFGAWDSLRHLWAQLRRGRFAFNIDLLMLVAAAGAAALGEWFEGSLLLVLFSLGHALEHYALGRARNAIKALAELAPQHATVIRNDREMKVPIAEVVAGDQVVVKPAERLPADGTVRDGRSAVNQAPITGESLPVDKGPGDQVFAGTVNGEGALVVTVTAAIGDHTIDRVIQLVSEAQTQKAPTQQFTDRFERVFVPVVLVVDVLLMVVPPLLGISTWPESIYRGMAMLIAASPCALALGTPAAVLAGLAQAARNGVLIKGGAYLETLGSIRSVALDKTGTITKGTPAVMELAPADGVQADELLQLAAAVEKRSQHPLAHAILSAAETRGLTIPAAGELESVTGRGVRAVVGAHHIEVGRLLMFEEPGAPAIPAAIRETVTRIEAAGQTTMVVRRSTAGQPVGKANSEWLGVIGVADELRPGVRATLDQLRQAGVRRIIMLTGDNEGVANAVGNAVGIDEVRAGLMPEDKVAAVRELAAAGGVAMIGDGVNDAPALATATVGIAMGGAGTAAALETADMALMGDDLGRLPFAMGLSRQARIIIQQNLFVSLTVIAVLVVVTGLGIAGIGLAVVIHEGSTLVVVANGLRLLAFRGGQDLAPAPKPGSS